MIDPHGGTVVKCLTSTSSLKVRVRCMRKLQVLSIPLYCEALSKTLQIFIGFYIYKGGWPLLGKYHGAFVWLNDVKLIVVKWLRRSSPHYLAIEAN